MMIDLEFARMFVQSLQSNGIPVPEEVPQIEAAVTAALSPNHREAHEKMIAAVAAGDADTALAASVEASVPVVIDGDSIEVTANESIRRHLGDGRVWQAIRAAFDAAGATLTDTMKIVDPAASPHAVIGQSTKVQTAYKALPEMVRRVGSLSALMDEYARTIGVADGAHRRPQYPAEGRLRKLAQLFHEPSDVEKRAELMGLWTADMRDNDTDRLIVATVRMGGVLEAPAAPTQGRPWELPVTPPVIERPTVIARPRGV